jgi:transcriptional regulator with XRE-family HTH domain
MKQENEMKVVEETKEDISFDVRPSTVFYEQWYTIIKDLPPKEKDKAYKYIFEYAFYGIEPEKDKTTMSYVVFGMAKPNIDSAQKRYDAATENGQKGGRPKKVTEEVREKIVELRKNGMTQKQVASELCLSLKTIQRVEKDISQNHNYNVNVNDNVNDNSVASDDVNTKVADAPTEESKLSSPASGEAQQTEIDFKNKVGLSNDSVKRAIDRTIKEINVDGHSYESMINYLVKEFMGAFYQCDKQAIIEYANRKLLKQSA